MQTWNEGQFFGSPEVPRFLIYSCFRVMILVGYIQTATH